MNNIILIALEQEAPNMASWDNVFFTGVGKVNASIALTTELAYNDHAYERVINYGSAGGNKAIKGQLVGVSAVIERDMDCTPLGLPLYVSPGDEEQMIVCQTKHDSLFVCGTGDSFSVPHINYQICEMEAYALAKVCAMMDRDFICYKYISDDADSNADDEWEQNVAGGEDIFYEKLKENHGFKLIN